jgi:hypothetical protein
MIGHYSPHPLPCIFKMQQELLTTESPLVPTGHPSRSISVDTTCSESGPIGLDVFAAVASSQRPLVRAGPSRRRASSTVSTNSNISGSDSGSEDASRKDVHNICERKRRLYIRQGFSALQDRLPTGHALRLGKMEILRASVEHIRILQDKTKQLEMEVEQLRAKRMARKTA